MSEIALSEKNKRLLAALGMSVKAGGIVFGVPMVCEALGSQKKGKRPLIVFEASDTSDNTHKRITDKVAFYSVPYVRLSTVTASEMGAAFGKTGALGVVGITEAGFVRACQKYLPEA